MFIMQEVGRGGPRGTELYDNDKRKERDFKLRKMIGFINLKNAETNKCPRCSHLRHERGKRVCV